MLYKDYKQLHGKKAIITKRINGHEFYIGEEIILIYEDECRDDIKGQNDKGERWWLQWEEFELDEVVIPKNSNDIDLNSIAYNVAINWNHNELGCPSPASRQMTTGLQEALDELVDYYKGKFQNNG